MFDSDKIMLTVALLLSVVSIIACTNSILEAKTLHPVVEINIELKVQSHSMGCKRALLYLSKHFETYRPIGNICRYIADHYRKELFDDITKKHPKNH